MTDSEEIHYSVADADDSEVSRSGIISPADIFRIHAQHPAQAIINRNRKVALTEASFYFSVL